MPTVHDKSHTAAPLRRVVRPCVQTVAKPVSRVLWDGEPSRRSFLSGRSRPRPPAAYPQRLDRGGHLSLLIWPCSRWGLPCRVCCQPRGELLPHLFTLAQPPLCFRSASASAVCFLWHCLSSVRPKSVTPRRYLAARPMEPGLSSSSIRWIPLATTRLATF